MPGGFRVRYPETGAALLAVLIILVVIAGSSVTFIWTLNQAQSRAGMHLRESAALSAAEAGVHRALSILEAASPDGRIWRAAAHMETLGAGALERRFTISVTDGPGGSILITSTGEAGGVTRRLDVRAHLAAPALLSALHGSGVVHLARPPAGFLIVPYGTGIRDRSWVHIAAGRGIEFATPDVSINDSGGVIEIGPGPLGMMGDAKHPVAAVERGRVRLLLGRGALLTVGPQRQPVDAQQLRALGVRVDGAVVHTDDLPPLPAIDARYFRSLASANTGNDDLNRAAGRYAGDDTLSRKTGSAYTHLEFERLAAYLCSGLRGAALRGVIYLEGGLTLTDGQSLRVIDGALITESTVFLGQGATLEVLHTPATRALPGILVLDDGGLIATQQSTVRAHGLVYVGRTADVGVGARVDVVGAILANDPEISFRSYGGSVAIRYDPVVLGTPGLRVPRRSTVVAWIAAWDERP